MGAIDCDTLVRGTPEQVRREVDYNLCWASPGGGHILCSGNTIQYGVPWENFETMLGRVREKGRYPIDRGGLEPATMYV
jgi:uroporphyrinogen-III decarboxylase